MCVAGLHIHPPGSQNQAGPPRQYLRISHGAFIAGHRGTASRIIVCSVRRLRGRQRAAHPSSDHPGSRNRQGDTGQDQPIRHESSRVRVRRNRRSQRITTNPTSAEQAKPTPSSMRSADESSLRSSDATSAASTNAGVPRRNANRAASGRAKCRNRAAVIVVQDREMPGNRAHAWARPMITASARARFRILRCGAARRRRSA